MTSIAPAVAGEGEEVAQPILIRRIAAHTAPGVRARVPRPVRTHRQEVVLAVGACSRNSRKEDGQRWSNLDFAGTERGLPQGVGRCVVASGGTCVQGMSTILECQLFRGGGAACRTPSH